MNFELKGPIIYFIEGRSLSSHNKWRFLHLAGALMEHLLEGRAALLRLW